MSQAGRKGASGGRRGVLAIALALVVCACSPAAAPPGRSAPGEVRFAILSLDPESDAPLWRPLVNDLGTRTGLKPTPILASNAAWLVDLMGAGRTDIGWFSGLSALEAVRRGGGEVFARAWLADGAEGDTVLLVASERRRVTLAQVLRCGRKLTLASGEASRAPGGAAAATWLFAPAGLDPETCFARVERQGSRQANLAAVAAGQADVATTSEAFFRAWQAADPRRAQAVRVLWRSPVLPGDPLVRRRNLDPAEKEKLRQFFLTYGQDEGAQAERERKVLAGLGLGGFRSADDSHLLPVREMEATLAWLAARRGGKAGEIAAARRRLQAIVAQRVALEARTRAPAAAQ